MLHSSTVAVCALSANAFLTREILRQVDKIAAVSPKQACVHINSFTEANNLYSVLHLHVLLRNVVELKTKTVTSHLKPQYW